MTRRRPTATWVAVGVAALVPALAPRIARAQADSAEAAATALFDDGRKLMDKHDYAAACPKLAESERLAPSGGTLLNLADCYEHNGQTASAWTAWRDAAARANAAGKADAERKALARAAALEPNLARLTITLDGASDVAGLQVKRDGVALGHAEFGTAIPVDPGSHLVEASAPSKQPLSTTVIVAAKQTDAGVRITLVDAPQAPPPVPVPAPPPPVTPAITAPAAPSPPPADEGSSWSGQKTLALVAGGLGVTGLIVGSAFGLQAQSKNDQALQPQNCRTPTLCTPTGLSLTSDAKNAANISTIAFAVGGVGVAAGVVLWVTAPSPARPSTGIRIVPTFAGTYGGAALDATW